MRINYQYNAAHFLKKLAGSSWKHTSLFGVMVCCFLATNAQQQTDYWSLERAVQYAHTHNLTVKTTALNERLAKLTWRQSQYSQIPSLNANTGFGRSFGRSVDPTTNQFTRGGYNFTSAGASSDVMLFGWFQKRNTIQANKLYWQAAKEDNSQIMDDISLNIANGFLRAVLAKEQIKVSEKQLQLSAAQLLQTQKFAESGKIPELNVAQQQSQLATDSANYITAMANYNAAMLDMRALLNLDFETPFLLDVPSFKDLPLAEEMTMNPASIYEAAAKRSYALESNKIKIDAAEKMVLAAKGARYPSLGLGLNVGTNWASTFREPNGVDVVGSEATPAFITIGGNNYQVYQPTYNVNYAAVPLFEQFNNNFRQTLNLSLNIPIFNGWQAQAAVRRARIDVERQQLQTEQTSLDLKNNIYKAHNDMVNAYQKYFAAKRAVDAANRAYDFAKKRYDLGLTNAVEYLATQNNQYQAESQLQSAKYDYLFRTKVIAYYLGKEIKL